MALSSVQPVDSGRPAEQRMLPNDLLAEQSALGGMLLSAEAVAEVTIAGNLKDMFRNLTPANDLTFRYGTNVPTLRVEGLTLAGD